MDRRKASGLQVSSAGEIPVIDPCQGGQLWTLVFGASLDLGACDLELWRTRLPNEDDIRTDAVSKSLPDGLSALGVDPDFLGGLFDFIQLLQSRRLLLQDFIICRLHRLQSLQGRLGSRAV